MEIKDRKTVFVLIDHPNHDFLLLPVIEKLSDRLEVEVMTCVYDYGNDRLLKEKEIPYSNDLAIFSDFLKKPGAKTFLSGSCDSDLGPHQRGKRLVMACRENGIPSLAIQHASAFMYSGWQKEGLSNSDFIAVYGRGDYEIYRALGKSSESLVITGSPIHDRLFHLNRGQGHSDEKRSPPNVKKGAYVLYAGINDLRVADSYKDCVALFNDFFNVLSWHFPNHDVILKPHPGEAFYGTIDLFKEAAGEDDPRFKIADPHALFPQLIYLSDLVISFSPSVLLESILLKKQVVYMNPQRTAMSEACERQGAHFLKTTVSTFPRSLEEVLPHIKENIGCPLKLSADFIEKVAYRLDGRAADRIALAVEQLLSKKRVNTVKGILQDTDANDEVPIDVQQVEDIDHREKEVIGPASEEPGTLDRDPEEARRHLKEGNLEKAVDIFKQMMERLPDSAMAHNDLGVAYYRQGNKAEALYHYEQAVRLDPENLSFLKNLADFYVVESGRIEDALVIYNAVLNIDPRDIETLMAMAHICVALDKPASAGDFYRKIVDIEPWNDEARMALEEMEKAESGPDDGNLTARKSRADRYYNKENRTDDAIQIYTTILADYPEDIETLVSLGGACVDLNRPDEAQVFFRKVLDVDPLNSVARVNLDKLGEYGQTLSNASAISGNRLQEPNPANATNRNYTVSAIVSTYNAEQFIRGCLEDLESQTIEDRLEIIVIDSSSLQNEGKIVEEFRQRYDNIKYIRTENRENVYAAWNRGIKIASGKYVTNANTDDRHCPDAFERMANILDRCPDAALVYADAIKTETANEVLGRHTKTGIFHWHDWDRDALLSKGCFIGPQPMWRRSVHDVYGFFDESLVSSGDYEFWLRISQTHEFFHLKMPLGLYLDRPDSIEHRDSETRRKEDEGILALYRQAAEDDVLIKCRDFEQPEGPTAVQDVYQAAASGSTARPLKENQIPIDQGDVNKMTTNIAFQQLVNHDDDEELTASLQKVVELYPGHAPAHHDLGGAYYQKGDNDNALAHYEKAVEIDGDNVIYQKSLADFYYSVAGRVEDALARYFKILDQQPRHQEALLMVGHISVALKKFDDAETYYKKVLEIEPQHPDAGLLVEKLQNRHQSDAGPATAEDQYADIQTMIIDGRANEAVSALETLAQSHPDFSLAHNDLGVLYYQQGDKDKALSSYETAARLEPDNITFQKNLADYYYVEQGRVEDAMQVYVKILEHHPEDCETLLILGHICVALHKFEDAETFYNRLLAVEPWNAEARENLEKLANRPDPIATETSPEEQYEKIQAAIDSGNGEALSLLQNLLKTHPQFALAHNDLGVHYYNQGDKEKALSHYEQAVQLEPGNLNFQKNLADFYFVESGRVEDALAVYKGVLDVDAEDVDALMSMGLICEAIERPEDARHFYNRVLETEPWNVDARQQLEKL